MQVQNSTNVALNAFKQNQNVNANTQNKQEKVSEKSLEETINESAVKVSISMNAQYILFAMNASSLAEGNTLTQAGLKHFSFCKLAPKLFIFNPLGIV